MSAYESVFKLAQEWEPEVLPSELKYRDSLVAFLRERLKDAKIEPEYRHSGTTTDIYVKQSGFFGSSEVFVELKRDLTQKSKYDRLVGQIEDLQPSRTFIIVVLCAETSPVLLSRFNERYRTSDLLSRVRVVLKPPVKAKVNPITEALASRQGNKSR